MVYCLRDRLVDVFLVRELREETGYENAEVLENSGE